MAWNGRMAANDELETTWKETVVTYLRYYPTFCLEELRKTTKNIDQDGRFPCRDSNFGHPEYTWGALTVWWSGLHCFKSVDCDLCFHISIDINSYHFIVFWTRMRKSSDCIVTRLRVGRPEFDSWQRQRIFSLRHRVQTGSGVHSASNAVGSEGSIIRGTEAGA